MVWHRSHINTKHNVNVVTIDRRPLEIDIITRTRRVLCAPLRVNIRSSFIDLCMHCVETCEMDRSFSRVRGAVVHLHHAQWPIFSIENRKRCQNVKYGFHHNDIDVVRKSLEKLENRSVARWNFVLAAGAPS